MQVLNKDTEYEYFKKHVLSLTNIDLNAYKEHQIRRRLPFIMDPTGAKDYYQYIKILASDEAKLNKFVNWLTINVSEFYRDIRKFDELKEKVLPHLLKRSRTLKIWSAGCSIGAEAYTVAIILSEIDQRLKHEIIATDLDERILKSARDGFYSAKQVQSTPVDILKKYFDEDDDSFRVKGEIKAKVTFKKHDLLKDPFDKDFDLILCRNVVIYFNDVAKDKIYRQFLESLKPGGILFSGVSESIMNASSLGFKSFMPFFYMRPEQEG
ncbi:MAG: protein-glutamate O-methyltransferase CheR [Actinomycetota bacterium]|nr:protein-glutamate O-methyltransferase CheR [Actinomycetota bacterium]